VNKKQALLLIALAAALLAVVLVARSNKQAPFLPRDAEHASFIGADACLTCHGPEGPYPRSKSHPNGFDCTRCHGSR